MMTKDRYERESCGWMRNLELKLFASLLPSKLERFNLHITVFFILKLIQASHFKSASENKLLSLSFK